MTKEELKEYLKENLRIEIWKDWPYMKVLLLLEDEVISRDKEQYEDYRED